MLHIMYPLKVKMYPWGCTCTPVWEPLIYGEKSFHRNESNTTLITEYIFRLMRKHLHSCWNSYRLLFTFANHVIRSRLQTNNESLSCCPQPSTCVRCVWTGRSRCSFWFYSKH